MLCPPATNKSSRNAFSNLALNMEIQQAIGQRRMEEHKASLDWPLHNTIATILKRNVLAKEYLDYQILYQARRRNTGAKVLISILHPNQQISGKYHAIICTLRVRCAAVGITIPVGPLVSCNKCMDIQIRNLDSERSYMKSQPTQHPPQ